MKWGRSVDFVAAYVNSKICNSAVITPQFGDKRKEKLAVVVLKKHFPQCGIVAQNVDSLSVLGDGIYCATQQLPAV